MARSMQAVGPLPEGSFEHPASGVRFTIRNTPTGVWQTLQKGATIESLPVRYIVGSGAHASGYLFQVQDHLFQSPLSFYTNRQQWDMAPGYENAARPDFSRPVTLECMSCHSDKPRPVTNTLNTFQSPPFDGTGIQCDRCHGLAAAHLEKPVPGSIINPARLPRAARDSICEQCHLTGEARVPNPGHAITDFQPGQTLEDHYTVYVARQNSQSTVKVVSQAEQLALSVCARSSAGKLWCGTCHNPHRTPAQPAAYYRQICLGCHAATLNQAHVAEHQECTSCHMAARPARDGGHTAFTDHRIRRQVDNDKDLAPSTGDLTAWREPEPALAQRNLALAQVTVGLQNRTPASVIQGYRTLNRLPPNLADEPAVLTALGNILLTGKQPTEAKVRFERALALRPGYAPYEVNLAGALLATGDKTGAAKHLEHALELDPLLQQAVMFLHQLYSDTGEQVKADALLQGYQSAMGFKAQ